MPAAKTNTTKSPKESAKKQSKKVGISGEQLLQILKGAAEQLREKPNTPLSEALSKSNVHSPIILLSNQHLRVKRVVNWLRENLLDSQSIAFTSAFGADLSSAQSVEHIGSALVSFSLFTKNQLVVIYEAEKIKAGAQKALLQAIERTNTSSLLILAAEAIPQKAGLLLDAASRGTVVELTELSGSTLDRWIDKEVQRCGIASGISKEARELLVTCYGGDVTALSREIEKLSLLVQPGEKIERQLVLALSVKTPEVTSFELIKQIATKNSINAVALTADLLEQGLHPLQLSAFLSRAFRTLLAHKEKSGAVIHSELNNPWFLRQLGNSASAYSPAELKKIIRSLAKLDFQLKDSGLPSPLTLSLTVQKISQRESLS